LQYYKAGSNQTPADVTRDTTRQIKPGEVDAIDTYVIHHFLNGTPQHDWLYIAAEYYIFMLEGQDTD